MWAAGVRPLPLSPGVGSSAKAFSPLHHHLKSRPPCHVRQSSPFRSPHRRCPTQKKLPSSKVSDSDPQIPTVSSVRDENVCNDEDPSLAMDGDGGVRGVDLGWLPAFPHVLAASMGTFIFGYHIGAMNGPITSIAQELGFEGNSFLKGLVVSIFIAGAFIGSISCGSLVDNLGFRRTLQIDAIPLILGAFWSARANTLDEVLWGRFLVGLGIGAITVLVPIYISEVSPTTYRGSLGSLCQIGTCMGIIASLFMGIPSEHDPHWWRTILYIAIFPAIILAIGMQFAVESPRWLFKAGNANDAKNVISNLWGESEVQRSIEDIQSVIKYDGNMKKTSWLELLVQPHRKVAFTGAALFVLQQFAGINGVLYFSSLTFRDVGITSGASASLFVGLTNLAGSLFSVCLMDKQGRKILLSSSYVGMAASMFLVAFAVNSPLDEGLIHNLSILGTLMYIFSFAIGAGPVTGIIIPELSSARTRANIMGLSFSVHWICNFLVGISFLQLIEKLGTSTVYTAFGAVSLAAALFSVLFIVETKGRSLEEIEMYLISDFPSESE